MTLNSSNKSPRSRSSRPERLSVRSGKTAPFGSMSTRPPTSPAPASLSARSSSSRSNSGKVLTNSPAVDEELWFGAHDHAVAEDAAARSMAALVGRIIGAKPFPMTARRLADLTRQDVVRIEPVIQVLESDPGLSARLLRLVNSAGYALRQRCTSVRHAATLVGTDRLHQIATTAAVLDLFDSKGPVAAQIIEHSTVVGAFCRYLGAHLALPVDDLFTAGFLHDIGKLMLMETENDQYVELLSKCGSSPDTIHLLERGLYGFDHAVLAAHVLSAWNIPDPVPKIVAWHHEPTHAYRVSSMMAALVQTVRLADALVYVMQADPERQNIKELAQHEAASYLDISEPQLAAMWDELQVLYNESREQCLGENAPALDPRSLKPKRPINAINASAEPTPSERTHELPKQFPCVECGCPTFGNTCPACGGYVCPDHQVGRDAWCALCARDYRSEKSSMPVPLPAKWAFGIVATAVAISGVAGMISAGGPGALRAGFGTLLLGTLVTLLYLVGKQVLIRVRFVRTRPNRFIAEALLNDGGTQSLVPPDFSEPSQQEAATSKGVFAGVDVRLVQPLKEIAIREISDHDYGVAASSRAGSGANSTADKPSPESDKSCGISAVDSNRVRLQSNSLVTLPVPAMHAGIQEGLVFESPPTSTSDPKRVPRDTLLERENGESAAAMSQTTAPNPLSTSNSQPDEDTDVQRDTLYGPDFEHSVLADQTLVSEGQAADEVATPALNCEREAVVRPMPTIDIVSEVLPVARSESLDTDSSGACEQPSQPPAAQPAEHDTRIVSVHPLAALGIYSEPAPAAEAPATLTEVDSTEPSAETQTAVESHSEPAPAAEAPAILTQVDSTPLDIVPPQVESKDNDAIESLIERSAAHFGEQFEARVRELVVQRVAEIVAERMLQGFGEGKVPKSTHSRSGKAQRPQPGGATPEPSQNRSKSKPRRRKLVG